MTCYEVDIIFSILKDASVNYNIICDLTPMMEDGQEFIEFVALNRSYERVFLPKNTIIDLLSKIYDNRNKMHELHSKLYTPEGYANNSIGGEIHDMFLNILKLIDPDDKWGFGY